MNKPFYVVWREGNRNPMVKHNTIDEAEQEAVRIATKEMTPVHILELRATCTVEVKAKWEYPCQPRQTLPRLYRQPCQSTE